jgi:hypothetical protein
VLAKAYHGYSFPAVRFVLGLALTLLLVLVLVWVLILVLRQLLVVGRLTVVLVVARSPLSRSMISMLLLLAVVVPSTAP